MHQSLIRYNVIDHFFTETLDLLHYLAGVAAACSEPTAAMLLISFIIPPAAALQRSHTVLPELPEWWVMHVFIFRHKTKCVCVVLSFHHDDMQRTGRGTDDVFNHRTKMKNQNAKPENQQNKTTSSIISSRRSSFSQFAR